MPLFLTNPTCLFTVNENKKLITLKNTDINNKHMSVAYTRLLYFSALINIRGFIVLLSIFRVRPKKLRACYTFRNQNSCCTDRRASPWVRNIVRFYLLVVEQPQAVDSPSHLYAWIIISAVFTGVAQAYHLCAQVTTDLGSIN